MDMVINQVDWNDFDYTELLLWRIYDSDKQEKKAKELYTKLS